jgi:hypothetical protein
MTHGLRMFALAALVCAAVPSVLAQQKGAAPPPKKNPLLKLAEPWPDDEVLLARRTEATARKLFQAVEPLEFTLTSDFNGLNKERNPDSTKRFPGTLSIAGLGKELPVQLGSRGHLRLNTRTCEFVPIRVEFPKEGIEGTPFEGQTNLKLGTHCQNDKEFDQYVLREYLAYRLSNLVTPRSYRARLARATYVDAKSKKTISTHNALFLEHDNDVARRLGGREVALPRIEFKDLDPDALTGMMLLNYMIGNTDYSIYALHNVKIVQDKKRTLIPVPYDNDMSGFVHPPYAIPDPRLHIRSVADRLYRGPCRTVEEFNTAAEPFRAKKTDMFAVIDGQKDLGGSHKSEMKDYLESFFKAIDSPEAIKKNFVNGCKPQQTM